MPATVQRLDCIFSGLHIVGAGGALANINIENGEDVASQQLASVWTAYYWAYWGC